MTRRTTRLGFGALVALTLAATACGGSEAASDATVADTVTVDSDAPDTTPADTTTPDTAPADTAAPETAAPDSTAPDTAAPDTTAAADVDSFFEAPNGDYTLVFPGEPQQTPLPVALPQGTVEADAYVYEDGADAAYITASFDYPDGVIDDDPTVVLNGARDGAVANVGGTLRDSEVIETNGIPGIRFTFDIDSGGAQGEGNAIVYFDQPRLYQSFALGINDNAADYQAFVDSFMFVPTNAEEG